MFLCFAVKLLNTFLAGFAVCLEKDVCWKSFSIQIDNYQLSVRVERFIHFKIILIDYVGQ
jgi:hypothetical protein